MCGRMLINIFYFPCEWLNMINMYASKRTTVADCLSLLLPILVDSLSGVQMNINESAYSCCWIISAIVPISFPMMNLFFSFFFSLSLFFHLNKNGCSNGIMMRESEQKKKEEMFYYNMQFLFFFFQSQFFIDNKYLYFTIKTNKKKKI